jgi:hypothetical protein
MAAMTEEHKKALAKGRAQARAVKEYLAAREVESKRGPKVTPEKLRDRIETTRKSIEEEDDPARRVELIQQRMDDEERLGSLEDQPDMEALEAAFVDAAGEYSERKGISYSAWRELGVPAAVLKRAGVSRTRRSG